MHLIKLVIISIRIDPTVIFSIFQLFLFFHVSWHLSSEFLLSFYEKVHLDFAICYIPYPSKHYIITPSELFTFCFHLHFHFNFHFNFNFHFTDSSASCPHCPRNASSLTGGTYITDLGPWSWWSVHFLRMCYISPWKYEYTQCLKFLRCVLLKS